MNFLTAQWRNLILVNYTVDPAALMSRVPEGLELDSHKGQHFVSLVGFQFLNTRVLGIKWPRLHSFVELNLRFYVKRTMPDGEVRRGVVFIKEIVPSRLISFVARTLYHEPYERWKIAEISGFGENDAYGYEWEERDLRNRIVLRAEGEHRDLLEHSHEQFIAEHYWGYTKRPDGKTNEYEVQHPTWQYREVTNVEVECDFGDVYGDDWAFLNKIEPCSVFLAEGSEISVAVKKSF